MDVTLKVKRYDPESGEAPHFQEYQVDLRSMAQCSTDCSMCEMSKMAHCP